ncbi:PREDICTED: octopamine receptor-like [Acropora digitifera]|uniref:octopamine receptor-like n=1 Tax=Acropora digitifera TaxID=70779 RepID=UPI00077A4A99|nr:PREDICTED: octopamine receptor-like [Acropora digitifera]
MDTKKIVSASSLANYVWTVCFTVEAFFAVSGNLVTIIVFQKKQLRRRPHFLLISLAVADLLVGLLSIPLNIAANYVQNGRLSPCFLALVRGADMLPGFASIFTLTVIALERMYAIGWPFRHRVLKIQSYVIAILTPWILAFVLTLCANLSHLVNKSFVALLLTFLIGTVVVTCVAYLVLWKKTGSQILRRNEVHETRDLRLGKTIAIITAAFLVTWLPFQILILTLSFCNSCLVSPATMNSTKLLHYANSIVNIVIYPVRNEEYRAALCQMFSSLWNRSWRSQKTASGSNFRNSTLFAVRKPSDTQRNFDHFHENTRL